MAIKGLTDQERLRIPSVGTIRKGAPKPEKGNRPGKDLSWFRLDTKDKNVRQLWDALYPGEPREFEVFLPYKEIEDNFSAWMEHWVAGGLVHRCDGEKVIVQRTKAGEYETHDNGTGPPCPGGCSIAGRLSVLIPEMRRMVTLTVVTSSKHDILNLSANLLAYYEIRENLRGIPFILRRVEKEVSTPGENGKRVRRKKWLLELEPAPAYVSAQLSYQASLALPRFQLPAGTPVKARIELDPRPNGWDEVTFDANGENSEVVTNGESALELPPERVVPTNPLMAKDAPPVSSSSEPPSLAHKFRTELVAAAESYAKGYAHGVNADKATATASPAQAGLIASLFTEAFAPDDNAAKEYHSALKFLFGIDSAKGLTFCQARSVLHWLTTKKDPATGEYPLNEGVTEKARLCLREAMLDAGQTELYLTI